MKKILIFIFCFSGHLVPAWACISSGPSRGMYEVQNGQVAYKRSTSGDPILIKEADAETLAYLNAEPPSTHGEFQWYFDDYVVDKSHVFYKGEILKGVSPAQASLLIQRYDQVILIDGLERYVSKEDRKKRDGYLKDKEYVYYHGQLLEGANGSYFE